MAKGSGEAQRLACLLRRLPAMFLNHRTMRLPGTIVNMRTARVPQKKDNAARANSRRVMMQEGDEKLSLKIPSHQAESGERASQQHRGRATVRNRDAGEQIDPRDAAETIRSGAGLWESV